MYIITTIADKSKKQEILGLVGDQKIVLKNLTNMLEQFESDADIKSTLTDMKEIAAIYESIQATQNTPATSDKDIISVGNNSSYELTKDQLKLILEKVTALRNKITL
jgi:TPP-dependent trihydroxycyclohexane-1,2-dione (THcHDO) dehydratase